MSFPQPLAGKVVLDLSLLLPGPAATGTLATFGAEVMKLEPPEGDPLLRMAPALHRRLNHAKSIERLDLKSDAGRARLEELATGADALVEGFRPGVMERLGVGSARLRGLNPRLVYAALSGYGATGPCRDTPAHDMSILAAAGYFSLPSELDGALARPNLRLADLLAAEATALAVFAALVEAGRTGRGAFVDLSLFDAMAAASLSMLLSRSDPEAPPDEQGQVMADSALYRCACGGHVAIATLEDRHWTAFAETATPPGHPLRDARWRTRAGRDADKRSLAALLAALFAERTRDAWAALFAPTSAPVAATLRGAELLADPHAIARGCVRFIEDAQGPLSVPAFPAIFDGARKG